MVQFLLPVGVASIYLQVDGKRVSENVMGNHTRRVLSKAVTSFAFATRTSGKSSRDLTEIFSYSKIIKNQFLGHTCPRIIPASSTQSTNLSPIQNPPKLSVGGLILLASRPQLASNQYSQLSNAYGERFPSSYHNICEYHNHINVVIRSCHPK